MEPPTNGVSRHKPKATAEVVRARTADILRIMLDGAQPWEIAAYVAEQEAKGEPPWVIAPGGKPLSGRQVRRYCARAEKAIGASCQGDREQLVGRHIAQRRALYARAVAKGDERTALACARDEAELLALYPAARHEVTGKGGAPLAIDHAHTIEQLSQAERLARVRQLVAAARSRQAALPYYPDGGTADAD
jgi:hypothetical protein